MQRRLAKAVRERFELGMKQSLPQFGPNRVEEIPATCRLYECKPCDHLILFVFLTIAPQDDRFTLDIGWSRTGKLPYSGCVLPSDPPKRGGLLFRLWRLWREDRDDYWWRFEPERKLENFADWVPEPLDTKLSRVQALVDDAVAKLREYGVPYFEKVAAEQGCPLKLK